jgi:cysteinyl-tRNA synthetase
MTIRIHDSLSREKRPLEPLEDGLVKMYVCGPTVYDDCHIGHLMGPVVFDTVARWLLARGLRVRFVNNITDIDDKIINRARETGEAWDAIAERYTQQYFGFLRELGVETITDHPRCTEFVPQMIAFIQELMDEDIAYVAEDGVYFDVHRHEGYGKLAGRRLEDMQAGARVQAQGGLRHPADFALWKGVKPGEPSWESPWGPGRPGWHIECSVMSSELLGRAFDLHGGGDDLKFPHHENEIAQSEARGDSFARLWMHNGLVQYGGRKVAKSDPRMQDPEFRQQFQARWLLETYGAPALRFFLVRSPYRRPVDFEPVNLEGARTGLVRLLRALGPLADEPGTAPLGELLAADLPEPLAARRARFVEAMDDDFNTGEAVAELFSLAADARAAASPEASEQALRLARDLGRQLGLFQPGDAGRLAAVGGGASAVLEPLAKALLEVRTAARERKAFAVADGLRDALTGAGVEVQDAAGASAAGLDAVGADGLERLMTALIALRADARASKDFATADALRDAVAGAGLRFEDGPEGTRWVQAD